MKIPSPTSFVSVALGILIVHNFIIQTDFIPRMVCRPPLELLNFPPGLRVEPLKNYLKGVKVAGYLTDLYDRDFWLKPRTMVFFQRAQYALSPTLLDIEQPLKHDVIVCECRQPQCYRAVIQAHGYEIVYAKDDRIALVRRKP